MREITVSSKTAQRRLRANLAVTPAAEASADDLNDQVMKIIETVSEFYGIRQEELLGRCRELRFVWPRQVAMVFAGDLLRLSAGRIGRLFGRDHGTVLHARKQVSAQAECYRRLSEELAECKQKVQEALQ